MRFNEYITFPKQNLCWDVRAEINIKLWGKEYQSFFHSSEPAEIASREVHYGVRDKVPQFLLGDHFNDDMGTIVGAWV